MVGEGEATWQKVLADAEAGRLEPVYRSDDSFDLADAPMPAFEMLDIDRYNRLPGALLMVFALMFAAIALRPVRNRGLIPYGLGLKVAARSSSVTSSPSASPRCGSPGRSWIS